MERFIARYFDIACNRFERSFQRRPRVRFFREYGRRAQFIHKSIGTVGPDDNFIPMLRPVIRTVFEYAAGSKKDKGEDDRDHHVVVETTTRVSP